MSASESQNGNNDTVDRAVAEVDLAAIAANIARLREIAPGSLLQAVVKADAYGHGMLPVAETARLAGVDYLGVALPAEAMQLRRAGDQGPLLCWLYAPGEDLTDCAAAGVEIAASSSQMLNQIAVAAQQAGARVGVHLKLDTGLGRNGATPQQWEELLRQALALRDGGRIDIVGIWSHLASADEPDSPATNQQLQVFREGLAQADSLGVQPRVRHLAASAGTFAFPATHFDMVRCGIAMYGLTPGPELGTATELGLRPAMTLKARVVLSKVVPAGHGVSYGQTYRAASQTRLALVPLGYADGIPRAGSGLLPVRVAERTFSVAGRVAMDQFVLDVGDAPIKAGAEVELFGEGRSAGPTADQWADKIGTIGYEIVTRIGPRVPRQYRGVD
ncbi:MAG: alanine racemase [Actinomycetia bacterium]|nr:alanine racemase [Actinomycetes bacterium]MCH9801742.1 alanine racemase [Actinomycetes bacterium]